jgi:hypothetical protein
MSKTGIKISLDCPLKPLQSYTSSKFQKSHTPPAARIRVYKKKYVQYKEESVPESRAAVALIVWPIKLTLLPVIVE